MAPPNRRSRLRNRIVFLLACCGLIASASAQSNFNRFNFTVGGGLGIGRGEVASFVGHSYHGVVGGGVNFSRILGVNAVYMYFSPSRRPTVMQRQSLNDASGNLQSALHYGTVSPPLHLALGA